MDIKKYIHENDIYHVSWAIQLEVSSDIDTNIIEYNLSKHRKIGNPSFNTQREILRYLEKEKLIDIKTAIGRSGKKVDFSRGIKYKIKVLDKDAIREQNLELVTKLTEVNLNHLAISDHGKALLSLEGNNIYVTLPTIKLRVNPCPLKTDSIPRLILDDLINEKPFEVLNIEKYSTSRRLDDIMIRAGFKGAVRAVFMPVCTAKEVQLLPETETSLKNIVSITRELKEYDFNKEAYEHYLEGMY